MLDFTWPPLADMDPVKIVEAVVAAWEEESGNTVELSYFTTEDLPKKILSAVEAGATVVYTQAGDVDYQLLCLREAGVYDAKLELLNPERSSIALGAQLFEELLRTRPDIDAVFFCNDDLAQGGLMAALRLGIAVPQRVAGDASAALFDLLVDGFQPTTA